MKRDKYHDLVKIALEKEGWTITHDPYFIRLGRRKGYIDLGAEMIGAERGLEKIAIEIKTFEWGATGNRAD
jgi:XisH protein